VKRGRLPQVRTFQAYARCLGVIWRSANTTARKKESSRLPPAHTLKTRQLPAMPDADRACRSFPKIGFSDERTEGPTARPRPRRASRRPAMRRRKCAGAAPELRELAAPGQRAAQSYGHDGDAVSPLLR
jgi:hypothetical protein